VVISGWVVAVVACKICGEIRCVQQQQPPYGTHLIHRIRSRRQNEDERSAAVRIRVTRRKVERWGVGEPFSKLRRHKL